MAYIGQSGQFDGGLTNPARQKPSFNPLMVNSKPTGTKPLPITPNPTGSSPGATPTANGTPAPAQSTDQYWPWPTSGTGSTTGSPINPNPTNGVQPGSNGPIHTNKPGIGPAPADVPFPDMVQGAADITGNPSSYIGYNPNYWKPEDIAIPEAGVDTRAIVESTRHFLDEEMAGGMGDAARRLGALGGLKSSGYAGTLGNIQRKRDLDLAAEYYKWDYDAAQQDANRKSTARENTLNRSLESWNSEQQRIFGDIANHNDFNVKQQQIALDIAKSNQDSQNQKATAQNNYNLDKYAADLTAAEKKELYDYLKEQYGG